MVTSLSLLRPLTWWGTKAPLHLYWITTTLIRIWSCAYFVDWSESDKINKLFILDSILFKVWFSKQKVLEIVARNKRTMNLKDMCGVILFSFIAWHIPLSGGILCRIKFVIHFKEATHLTMNLQNDVLCESKFLVSRSILNPVSHQKKGSFPYPVLILGIIRHPVSFSSPVSPESFFTNPVSRGSKRPYPVSRETLSGAP